jgi:hypothetical protein
METEIIGDGGTEWTDTPRALTEDERNWMRIEPRLKAIRLHRELTNSTLAAAIAAVDEIRQS